MISKEEIVRMLRAGQSLDAICADVANTINAAKAEYEKEQEDNKRAAELGVAADRAAAALNDYFKLRYPDEEFAPIDRDLLDIVAESIFYGVEPKKESLEDGLKLLAKAFVDALK